MKTDLDLLYNKVEECDECSISKLSVNDFKLDGKRGKEPILIVSQNPSCAKTRKSIIMGGFDKLYSDELDKLLERCYITNIIKCSFIYNRVPKDIDNIAHSCIPWLLEEIKTVRPKLIIVVGRIARTYLPIKEIMQIVPNVVLVNVSHPAFYARQGRSKEFAEKMIRLIKRYV
jgi:uracil-DNA glycosylase family 4